MEKYIEQFNKEILLFTNKELFKINKKLKFGTKEVNLCKNKISFISLRIKRNKLQKDKDMLILIKCLTKINKLNNKAILELKRCQYTIDKMRKIELQIIEQENIIKAII